MHALPLVPRQQPVKVTSYRRVAFFAHSSLRWEFRGIFHPPNFRGFLTTWGINTYLVLSCQLFLNLTPCTSQPIGLTDEFPAWKPAVACGITAGGPVMVVVTGAWIHACRNAHLPMVNRLIYSGRDKQKQKSSVGSIFCHHHVYIQSLIGS
jgi:hypothetical protein